MNDLRRKKTKYHHSTIHHFAKHQCEDKISIYVHEFSTHTHTHTHAHTHTYNIYTYVKIKVQYVIKKEGNPFGGYLTGVCSNAQTILRRMNVKFVHFFFPLLSLIFPLSSSFFSFFFFNLFFPLFIFFFVKGYPVYDKKYAEIPLSFMYAYAIIPSRNVIYSSNSPS